MLSAKEIFSVTLILFSVIDMPGNIAVVLDLRKKLGHIQSEKATLAAGVIMIVFLFLGEQILNLFNLDIGSFAISGAIIMFLIGMEMVLGLSIFKSNQDELTSASIVPLAFPLIAGAGTMTTLISLRAEFAVMNILIGVLLNLTIVYTVLKTSGWLSKKIGIAGFNVLRKVFGIILLSIAIKLFKTHWFI